MKDIKKEQAKAAEQLNREVLRRHRDEDMRDDDVISSSSIADSKLPTSDPDDDDANLQDNDFTGRDLDIENSDEWDAENMSARKNPETNPEEMPPEVQPKKEEVNQPRKDNMEHAKKNEADYKHTKEVNPPKPEHKRKATLDTLDPSNVGVEHNRKTERMVDHEPGSGGDHRAPNL